MKNEMEISETKEIKLETTKIIKMKPCGKYLKIIEDEFILLKCFFFSPC